MNAERPPSSDGSKLRIAVFGPTGVAGAGALRACLGDPRVGEVVAVVRRSLGMSDPKLREVLATNFRDLTPIAEQLRGLGACLYCLGVSQNQVPEEARYREITYDYALAAARTLLAESPGCVLHFLSGSGTDPTGRSRWMWARVKGETESALQGLGLAGVVCWRPGYIHPAVAPEGRQFAERLARVLYPLLRPFPGLSIAQHEFGQAMLQATLEGQREGVMENRDIRAAAARYSKTTMASGAPR